jgi:SAM-dependent methyltransferase
VTPCVCLLAGSRAATVRGVSRYDAHYRAGGFGYEKDRPKHVEWVRLHYVDEFDLRPGARLLDVGCGNGFWTGIFAELGFDASGFDLSDGGIEVARDLYPDLRFEVANVEEPSPFGPAAFDIVFCRGLTHFCMEDLTRDETQRAIGCMMDSVAPGGILLVSQWTDRTNRSQRTCFDHRVSALIGALESAGDPCRYHLFGNYVQIAVRHKPPS